MINIALLGLGTVGQGVVEIIDKNREELKSILGKELNIKKILVKNPDKDRGGRVDKNILTFDYKEILDDHAIDIIIEVTGALEEGYSYIREALAKGKDVVTANKALVSKYFEELHTLARDGDRAFLYEASVGGGIPILKPLKDEIVFNQINQVQGILNGTCNYILTRMFNEGLDYDETLRIAQELGYAEADPTDDVEGYDTQRKLRILSTIAFKGKVQEDDIIVRGIKGIKAFDIEKISGLDSTIKLIGEARLTGDRYTAIVQPTLIKNDSYFANVNMAFNSISITGDKVGELKFYGAGAGKLPTADAVLRDVLDIVENSYRKGISPEAGFLKNDNEKLKSKYYLRVTQEDKGRPDIIEEMADRILSRGDNEALITKTIYLRDVLDAIKLLGLKEKDYFLARILE